MGALAIYDELEASDVDHPAASFELFAFNKDAFAAVSFLVSFALARYIAFVNGRYNERFNNVCKTNGRECRKDSKSALAQDS